MPKVHRARKRAVMAGQAGYRDGQLAAFSRLHAPRWGSLSRRSDRSIGPIRYPARDLTASDRGGLQVETARGWVDVLPRPGTLVVNIGEILELASDGCLHATLHRVITLPAGRERLSAAFFLGARRDASVSSSGD